MSWSLDAVIKTGSNEVQAKVKALFEKTSVPNPEERAIRDQLCEAALSCIAGNTPGQYLRLEASGSAYGNGESKSQTCRLSVQAIYGGIIE